MARTCQPARRTKNTENKIVKDKTKNKNFVKDKTKTTENKIDMTLDAIIKLKKSEKKKQIKAKKQTSIKKQLQQRNKLRTNVTSLKSVKLTKRKTIPGKKHKQQQVQQRLGVQRQHAAFENLSKKENKRQDNNRTFSKVKRKGNDTSGRNAIKQQYSKNARENLVNSRRKLQSQLRVNQKKSSLGLQKPKRAEMFTHNKKQNIQDKNQGGNSRGRRRPRRSFDERLNQATENASKLNVRLENPKAKLSSTHSISAQDLIQMQFSSISAVTGKTALSIPENPRPQRQRMLNTTKFHPLRISVNNDLVQSCPHDSLLFNHESRIDIPLDKEIPTLNERFSSMPVDKDDYSIAVQGGRSVSIPIVID